MTDTKSFSPASFVRSRHGVTAPAGETLSAADYQILLARSLAGLEQAVNDAANLMYLSRFNPGIYDEYIRRKSR